MCHLPACTGARVNTTVVTTPVCPEPNSAAQKSDVGSEAQLTSRWFRLTSELPLSPHAVHTGVQWRSFSLLVRLRAGQLTEHMTQNRQLDPPIDVILLVSVVSVITSPVPPRAVPLEKENTPPCKSRDSASSTWCAFTQRAKPRAKRTLLNTEKNLFTKDASCYFLLFLGATCFLL